MLSWVLWFLRVSLRSTKGKGSHFPLPFWLLAWPDLTIKQSASYKVFSLSSLAFSSEEDADLYNLFHRLTPTTFLESKPTADYFFVSRLKGFLQIT